MSFDSSIGQFQGYFLALRHCRSGHQPSLAVRNEKSHPAGAGWDTHTEKEMSRLLLAAQHQGEPAKTEQCCGRWLGHGSALDREIVEYAGVRAKEFSRR